MTKIILATRNWSSWPDFAGATWVPLQYLLGFEKLGVDVYWVDYLDAVDPYKHPHSLDYLIDRFDSTANKFSFLDRYCIIYAEGERYFGLSQEKLARVAKKTDLLLSISGTGLPKESPLLEISRRAYVDVDPGFTQIWAQQVEMGLEQYNFFFTVGQNVGRTEFTIPTKNIEWKPIFPPVFLDAWPVHIDEKCRRFSTIADWWGNQWARYDGVLYGSKREEFLRFIRVPKEANQEIEVALFFEQDSYKQLDELRENNWKILNPILHAGDPLSYREFIQYSRAEFSTAKNGYVRSNSGWVSDRTACYLASGKPAVIQSTGFEWRLPTGEGLLTYHTVEEAVAGIEAINQDYRRHCHAARQLAEKYFNSDFVLRDLLEQTGI